MHGVGGTQKNSNAIPWVHRSKDKVKDNLHTFQLQTLVHELQGYKERGTPQNAHFREQRNRGEFLTEIRQSKS